MREIKFRGKRIDSGEWIYGYYVKDPQWNHRIYLKPFEDASSNTYYFVDLKTVGQFIGLTDKNNNEIYEGDILCVSRLENSKHKVRGVIEWRAETASYTLFSPRDAFEIIGNIFDNPELLK